MEVSRAGVVQALVGLCKWRRGIRENYCFYKANSCCNIENTELDVTAVSTGVCVSAPGVLRSMKHKENLFNSL